MPFKDMEGLTSSRKHFMTNINTYTFQHQAYFTHLFLLGVQDSNYAKHVDLKLRIN